MSPKVKEGTSAKKVIKKNNSKTNKPKKKAVVKTPKLKQSADKKSIEKTKKPKQQTAKKKAVVKSQKPKKQITKKKVRKTKLKISTYIPEPGIKLTKLKGKDVVNELGKEIIQKVVISVFKGENIRGLTEELTRKRLSLSNAAMLVTLIKSTKNIDKLLEKFTKIIKDELSERVNADRKLYLRWILGLTGKSIQNVTRKNESAFTDYVKVYEKALNDAKATSITDYGDLEGKIKIGEDEIPLNWGFINLLFASIGAQTLTIRGSEKSMYGKTFEKLMIGSLLSILGFEFVKKNTTKTSNVFWLSEREDKRESDATLLLKPGTAARFDIGFIGTGNTEISLDKVTRFEKEFKKNDEKYYSSTIIIVDKIGDKSRIVEMAKEIGGSIVQMSMAYWIKDICKILKEKLKFEHKILKMSDDEISKFIEAEIKKLDLGKFLETEEKVTTKKSKSKTASTEMETVEEDGLF